MFSMTLVAFPAAAVGLLYLSLASPLAFRATSQTGGPTAALRRARRSVLQRLHLLPAARRRSCAAGRPSPVSAPGTQPLPDPSSPTPLYPNPSSPTPRYPNPASPLPNRSLKRTEWSRNSPRAFQR